jgi:hypothetical protein
MRSDGVVVSGIGNWNPAQMCLARDNDVVQTLAPDRSHQPFGKAVLPALLVKLLDSYPGEWDEY